MVGTLSKPDQIQKGKAQAVYMYVTKDSPENYTSFLDCVALRIKVRICGHGQST